MGLAGPWPWIPENPARGTPRGGVHAVSYFTNLGLRLSRMTLAPCLKDDCHFRPAPKRRLVGCIGK